MGVFDFLKKKELKELADLKNKLKRFEGIINLEEEINKKRAEEEENTNKRNAELNQNIELKLKEISIKEAETEFLIKTKQDEIKELQSKLEALSSNYGASLEIYTKLRKDISLYENRLDIVEFGIYEPIFDFERSDDYRKAQNLIIDKQKAMIQADTAAHCNVNWTIDGSEAKGRASTQKIKKLVLRAFNGECNALISKVKWNNIDQMKDRIQKSYDAINKLGESSAVKIQHDYLNLKLQELILEHEFNLKRQQEKEELRSIQEELREEEKARREFEQAQKEAEKEEANYQRALEKAKKEIELATGEKYSSLLAKIEILERELLEAQEKKERALSMAQQTKRGHVYIISNIGSFGENVYKIGMTRRLEPTDRIKELGDASVPFQFDVHAMIYSDEARTLEYELHKAFSSKKVNMLNYRKEFFNVSLDDIEQKIKEIGIEAEFVKLPEAMEYRETLAIIEKMNNSVETHTLEHEIELEFPKTLIF